MALTERRPIALVFIFRTNSFYAIVWDSVDKRRVRTLHEIKLDDGNIIEGTYMITRKSILQSIEGHTRLTDDDRQTVLFDHNIVQETTACVALPYHVYHQNTRQQMVMEVHYLVRTEKHTELRRVNNGIPTFSYPCLHVIDNEQYN